MNETDVLAQKIRRVDGNHSLGAGALAEALMPWLAEHDRQVTAQALRDAAKVIYDEWPGGTGHEGLGIQWAEEWLDANADLLAPKGALE